MISQPWHPLLLIISAPSGAGKSTLCERLMKEFPFLVYSISCTTRPPRPGEVEGTHYFFLNDAEFEKRVEKGDFLEHTRVHENWYGTLHKTVTDSLEKNLDVLMDIDVQGASKIREITKHSDTDPILRKSFVDIFISPPSIDILRKRLIDRGQDDHAVIEKRLIRAEKEIAHWRDYQYLIINDNLDQAYNELKSILCAEHLRIRAGDSIVPDAEKRR